MKRNLSFIVALCMAALLFSAGEGHSGTPVTIKLGCDNTSGGPWDIGLNHFMKLVEEKIPGRVKFQYYPDGQLSGNDQRTTIEMLQTGTIHMAAILPSIYEQFDQRWQIYSLPYLFTNIDDARASCDGEQGQYMLGLLPEKLIHGLALWEHGWRHLTTTNKLVRLPADINGMKIRIMDSPTYVRMFSSLGAIPTVTSMGELFTALQQGAVDGQENPLSTIARRKFDEVQKYLILTHHSYSPLIFGANKPFFDRLPADVKKAIGEAAIEAREFQRAASQKEDSDWTVALRKTMTVIELTDAELKAWQDATAGVAEGVRPTVGDKIFSLFGK